MKFDFCRCIDGDFGDTNDGHGDRGLDDADGLWPMVMELFTKMPMLMQELMLALMLLPAILPLMLHLSGWGPTVEHRKACIVSTTVQFSGCTIACFSYSAQPQYNA